jgi:hypothetical protein
MAKKKSKKVSAKKSTAKKAKKPAKRAAPKKAAPKMSSGASCGPYGGHTCGWCTGLVGLVAGVLLLINHQWVGLAQPQFWGALLVIYGLLKLIWPKCGCHS